MCPQQKWSAAVEEKKENVNIEFVKHVSMVYAWGVPFGVPQRS